MYLSSHGDGGTVAGMATVADVRRRPHERNDRWWLEDVFIVTVLGGFGLYAFAVSVLNGNYFYEPYLSPFYSPCLTTSCVHPTFAIIGNWYNLSPAFLIVGSPLLLPCVLLVTAGVHRPGRAREVLG